MAAEGYRENNGKRCTAILAQKCKEESQIYHAYSCLLSIGWLIAFDKSKTFVICNHKIAEGHHEGGRQFEDQKACIEKSTIMPHARLALKALMNTFCSSFLVA